MTEIVAEIGRNHNGSIEIASRLIDAACFAGADFIKFQKRDPDVCVPEDQRYVRRETPWGEMAYLSYCHRMEFSAEEHHQLEEYAERAGLGSFFSVWDEPSLAFALQFRSRYVKIPSAKLTDAHLVRKAAESGRHVILSTGMSTTDEIDIAESILRHSASEYTLMHCHSAYPAPYEELNLRAIHTLKERYLCRVGYSGHEYGVASTVWAVAMGAEIVERHITLDHNMWGSDHESSVEPHAFHRMVQRIRTLEDARGDGELRLWKSELPAREKLRGP